LQALIAIELAGVRVGHGGLDALLAVAIADQAGSAVEDTNTVLERAEPSRNIVDACVAVAVTGLGRRAIVLATSILGGAAGRRYGCVAACAERKKGHQAETEDKRLAH
jgi:hypothetical protein